MQEMYQQFIDDDQSWKDIKKEDVSKLNIIYLYDIYKYKMT